MNNILDELHNHCNEFFRNLKNDLDKDGGFVCSRQIQDTKNILSCIEKISRIKSIPTIK